MTKEQFKFIRRELKKKLIKMEKSSSSLEDVIIKLFENKGGESSDCKISDFFDDDHAEYNETLNLLSFKGTKDNGKYLWLDVVNIAAIAISIDG